MTTFISVKLLLCWYCSKWNWGSFFSLGINYSLKLEWSRWHTIANPHASHLKQSWKMAKSSTRNDPISNFELIPFFPFWPRDPLWYKVSLKMCPYLHFLVFDLLTAPGGTTKNNTALTPSSHVVIKTTKFGEFLHSRLEVYSVTDGQTEPITKTPRFF